MLKNQNNKEDLNRIKEKGLFIISSIEEDFESVVNLSIKKHRNKNAKKSMMSDIFQDFPSLSGKQNSELEELILGRKDRKYAALTIELASTMEYFLRELYLFIEKKQCDTSEKGYSNIQILERELDKKILIGSKGKLGFLNNIRNKIIHGEFSLKKAKEHTSVKKESNKIYGDRKVKSSEYIKDFINSSKDYINSIDFK